jgi:hypothetical protein
VRTQPRKKAGRKPGSLFKALVVNAFDFANKSIDEFQTNPKYSVIDFCAALELFLKAKLMLEHWSLIVDEPHRAEAQAFREGRFQSVSMIETIRRLENIAGQRFVRDEKDSFKAIREHRNRLVHFFHPNMKTKAARERIATEEWSAWFHLHRLLTGLWKRDFRGFALQISQLDRRLRSIRGFLQAKFDAAKPEIKMDRKEGIRYSNCWSCDFRAYRAIRELPAPEGSKQFLASCRVCDAAGYFLLVECPDCAKPLRIDDLGEGTCRCGYAMDVDSLVELLGPNQEPGGEPTVAYCTACERGDVATVVPINGGYLCVSCFAEHDRVGNCGYCSTLNAGDINHVDSSLFGCVLCEGSMAQDNT